MPDDTERPEDRPASQGPQPPSPPDEDVAPEAPSSEEGADACDQQEPEQPPEEKQAEEQPPEDQEAPQPQAEGEEREEPEQAPAEEPETGEPPHEEEREGEEGEEQEEQEAQGPTPLYDGLDSGLAWFSAEPFVPPALPGYAAPPEERTPPAGAAVAAPAARRQRIRERLEARRKEAEAQKKWYQKIPLAAYVPIPATIFIIVWIVFVARPWARVPEPKEKIGDAVLTGQGMEEQAQRLRELNVTLGPGGWRLLPGDVFAMSMVKKQARLTRRLPQDLSRFVVSCEAGIIEGIEVHTLRLELDKYRFLGLVGLEGNPSECYITAAGRKDARPIEWQQHVPLKYGYWYKLRMEVNDEQVRYQVNGQSLSPEAPPAGLPAAVTIKAENARIAVRNWRIEPLQ